MKELRRQNGALQRAAAAAGEAAAEAHAATAEARAAAVEAALRPPVAEAAAQATASTTAAEMQTEGTYFRSHSWQPRAEEPWKAAAAASAELAGASTQTAPPSVAESAAQTRPEERPVVQDAAVGGEEPLRLALGCDALAKEALPEGLWRANFTEGMLALVRQWQGKCEDSEAECRRLQALLAAADGSGPPQGEPLV